MRNSKTTPAASAKSKQRAKQEELPKFTPEQLEGFKMSEELTDIVVQIDAEREELRGRQKQAIDAANRQVSAFDGAIEELDVFKNKMVYNAQRKYVEGKGKTTPPVTTPTTPRTRTRMSSGTGAT